MMIKKPNAKWYEGSSGFSFGKKSRMRHDIGMAV
jgi:hypothetical protein